MFCWNMVMKMLKWKKKIWSRHTLVLYSRRGKWNSLESSVIFFSRNTPKYPFWRLLLFFKNIVLFSTFIFSKYTKEESLAGCKFRMLTKTCVLLLSIAIWGVNTQFYHMFEQCHYSYWVQVFFTIKCNEIEFVWNYRQPRVVYFGM